VDATFLFLLVVLDVGGKSAALHHEGHVLGRLGELDEHDGGHVVLLVREGVIEMGEPLHGEVVDVHGNVVFVRGVLSNTLDVDHVWGLKDFFLQIFGGT